jgi:hypothetical protein
MPGRGSFGSLAMEEDDESEEEIDRLLAELGLELPDVENDADGDGLPPPLDDWGAWE